MVVDRVRMQNVAAEIFRLCRGIDVTERLKLSQLVGIEGRSVGADVDVEAPRVLGRVAEMGRVGVGVLNQMIPRAPFPDDLAARRM